MDTSDLSITIVPELSPNTACGEHQPWSGIKISHSQFCREEYPHYGAFAHEYFHELQEPYIFDRVTLPFLSPKWFKEGSAEYFRYRWAAQMDFAPLDPDVTTKSTYGHYRSTAADRAKHGLNPAIPLRSDGHHHALRYILGFLAIDYIIAQTSENENKVATFFTDVGWQGRLNPFGFGGRFQEVFGISLDDFYACFAAHRAAEFPQPGAPCEASSDPPTPAPAPAANERIVFSSNRDGNSEIYAMNADGTGVSRLTNHSGSDYSPAWSPDRQRIAFTSNRSGEDEIYVMNADGTGVSRLTYGTGGSYQVVPPGMSQPAWSPDGQRIAVSWNKWGDNLYWIHVMNADGTNVSQLSNGIVDSSPSWSPDGQRIAFESVASYSPGTADIYVVNADGSNLTRLTTHDGHDETPAWSPDGERIAFTSWRNGGVDIYIMNADGSNQTRLTDGREPAWSPDGQRIAFSSNRDIYAVNADGSNQTRLTTHSAADLGPHWTSAAGSGLGPILPPGGGNIADRVSQLERQVSALQSEASAQQTRIDALDRLLATLQSLVDKLAARVAALESATPQPTPAATPTPTPTPAATINSACIEKIELDSLIAGTTITGTWTTDCLSTNRKDGDTYYAKFYTFTLDDQQERHELEFTIDSDSRPYIYLMSDKGTVGDIIGYYHRVVAPGGIVQLALQPGSYTLEVTTLESQVTGDFNLWMGLRP